MVYLYMHKILQAVKVIFVKKLFLSIFIGLTFESIL